MKHTKRLISFLLCMVILVSSCLSFSATGAKSLTQQRDELKSQLASLKSEQQRYAKLLKEASNKVNSQQARIQYIYAEINNCQKQISTISSLITQYQDLVSEKKAEIDRLNAQLDNNFSLFKERLVFAQESGNMSYIDFILGSADLSDIISRAEVINDMLANDRKIIESLVSDREAIEKAKSEIDIALKECQEQQAEQEALIESLKEKKAQAEAELAALKDDKANLDKANSTVASELKKAEKDLQEVMDRIAAQSVLKPGPTGFVWPLTPAKPGYVTQKFGNKGHRGVDIGVGGWSYNGKVPTIAIAAGKVVERAYHYSWGNYVLVDHGGGYVSRYAHLHSFSVSQGQTVVIGQQIGMIGSTGNSTGPHLHLELMAPVGAGGKSILTDPLKYCIKP